MVDNARRARDETACVLARLEEPNKLVIETCIATGARISQVLGLKWKHVNLDAATIKVEQRVWQQDVGSPKSEAVAGSWVSAIWSSATVLLNPRFFARREDSCLM
ncbi:MAG: tyrosine-type recombinase/integrase, partial [Acidobacteriota bacterium]